MAAFADVLASLRKQEGLSQQQFAEKTGLTRSAVGMYETGKREPDFQTLALIADFFHVNVDTLLGKQPQFTSPSLDLSKYGLSPIPPTNKIPRVGQIACGTPILAEQNVQCYDDIPSWIKCDFTLTCHGDSMINARIFDGDVVCIHQQPEVENGEIAAVMVDDDTATLKRVRIFDDHIILEPANPLYPPQVFWNSDMARVRILGKATHFLSTVR